jgi:hypothetical protein
MYSRETLFKVLGDYRKACSGGFGHWPEVGTWWSVDGRIKACDNGLHLIYGDGLLTWINDGCALYVAEYDETEDIDTEELPKIAVRRARLTEHIEKYNQDFVNRLNIVYAEHVYEQVIKNETERAFVRTVLDAFKTGTVTKDQQEKCRLWATEYNLSGGRKEFYWALFSMVTQRYIMQLYNGSFAYAVGDTVGGERNEMEWQIDTFFARLNAE